MRKKEVMRTIFFGALLFAVLLIGGGIVMAAITIPSIPAVHSPVSGSSSVSSNPNSIISSSNSASWLNSVQSTTTPDIKSDQNGIPPVPPNGTPPDGTPKAPPDGTPQNGTPPAPPNSNPNN